ncbi:MAG: aldehyde ferredoxin oxidoreductase family protein [Sulfolobales archaeon]
MVLKGYSEKILHIDLTSRSFRTEDLDPGLARAYIGGKGLANYYLYKYGIWNHKPYSPENPLIIALGPFSGTQIPMATRAWAAFRSPLTNILGGSNVGGVLAAIMKYSGYDMVFIRGSSEKPIYIVIERGSVEFRDASHLWGLDAIETEEILKKDHGRDSAVLSIGPAGENLVRFAMINHDKWRQFGRTGGGAVMGSKKLKAVVFIPGDRRIDIAYPDKFRDFMRDFIARFTRESGTQALREGGTPRIVEIANRMGFFPCFYWAQVTIEGWEKIEWKAFKNNYFIGPAACLYCPAACHRLVESKRFSTRVDIEYETIFALGGLIGVTDPDWIIQYNDLADRLGMDTISLGNVIGFAIDLDRRGVLKLNIKWGDAEKIRDLIYDIAYRRGVGDLLAEGVAEMSRRLGVEDLAVHVKGLEPAGYDPRSLKGMALGYAISGRGADHLGTMAYAIDIAGRAGGRQYLGEEKIRAIIDYEDLGALMDSLLLCKFGRYIYTFDVITELLNIVTGFNYTVEDIRRTAWRIVTVTRIINSRMGVNRSSDMLPRRFFEPVRFQDSELMLSREEFETALDTYYKLRGWSSNGVPTDETLKLLGIL